VNLHAAIDGLKLRCLICFLDGLIIFGELYTLCFHFYRLGWTNVLMCPLSEEHRPILLLRLKARYSTRVYLLPITKNGLRFLLPRTRGHCCIFISLNLTPVSLKCLVLVVTIFMSLVLEVPDLRMSRTHRVSPCQVFGARHAHQRWIHFHDIFV
jgi:hypothetical protein